MLTLFTYPSVYPWFHVYRFLRDLIFRLIGKPLPKYGGHPAVSRSIFNGLNNIEQPYRLNPVLIRKFERVHVFSNVRALRMAIFLKKVGLIKHLTAGPNIVVSSADEGGILASKYIDKILVPSEWVKTAYLADNRRLDFKKVSCWPSGVDPGFWNVHKSKIDKRLAFLFYCKSADKYLVEECYKITTLNNVDVVKLNYGNYTLSLLKEMLTAIDVVVYFSKWESQGIALAEIWATDTPTFVWNPQDFNYEGRSHVGSSAPYLSPENGVFFTDIEDYKQTLNNYIQNKLTFSARKYVLENLTDAISAKDFLKKIS